MRHFFSHNCSNVKTNIPSRSFISSFLYSRYVACHAMLASHFVTSPIWRFSDLLTIVRMLLLRKAGIFEDSLLRDPALNISRTASCLSLSDRRKVKLTQFWQKPLQKFTCLNNCDFSLLHKSVSNRSWIFFYDNQVTLLTLCINNYKLY